MPTYQELIGHPAPAFTLPNSDGKPFEFKPGEGGRPTALLFYPDSGSYGCTQQACQFRDAIAEKVNFKPEKVQVIGISWNTVEKQKQFVEQQKLTYPVLSDPKREVVSKYGVGKGMMGIAPVARTTFVIDKSGIVRDALDATMNYGAHQKFVEKWLVKLAEEEASKGFDTTTD